MAAFGKHPGWDDHIPDLGHMTNRLIEVKRELYVDGIGGNIDSGTWDRLEDQHRLEAFHHFFLWRSRGSVVAGRMWSSSDGKGRKRYPMIVCAHCTGLPLSWVVPELFARFDRIENRCTTTTESADVVSIIDESSKQLSALAGDAQSTFDPQKDRIDPLPSLADHPDMGPQQQGLLRVLYQIEREIIGPRAGRSAAAVRAKHIRVPTCAQTPSDAALLWCRFLTGRLGENRIPDLVVLPLGQTWVDLIVGDQVAPQLYGIRVLPSKLPLTTEVPYNLDEAFVQQARKIINADPTAAASSSHTPGHGDQPAGGAKRRFGGLWLLLAVVGVVLAVLGGLTAVGRSGVMGEDWPLDPLVWIRNGLDQPE